MRLSRPTSRRRSRSGAVEVNLVPLLDTLVTLIAFLMFSMSMVAVVAVDSLAPVQDPKTAPPSNQKPLQLTLTVKEREMELWSPFKKITPMRFAHTEEGHPDLDALHGALLALKERFPKETQVLLMPYAGLSYDDLIAIMDAARLVRDTDPTRFEVDPNTGINQVSKFLFPEVVFGNIIDGT